MGKKMIIVLDAIDEELLKNGPVGIVCSSQVNGNCIFYSKGGARCSMCSNLISQSPSGKDGDGFLCRYYDTRKASVIESDNDQLNEILDMIVELQKDNSK